MSIRNRIDDALFLWDNERLEGAFLSALVAVAATSRLLYPKSTKIRDVEAFENFLRQGVFERIKVEYDGEIHFAYHVFYEWFRCKLVHEGVLPLDIELMPDTTPGSVSIRAGGAPEKTLKVSYGWFHEIVYTVVNAPINKEIFKDHKYLR
jgi:hypothetical protein